MFKLFIIYFFVLNGFLIANSLVKTTLTQSSKFLKSSKIISNNEIIKLSKISDNYKGTKKVKEHLGKLNLPLSMQEDIYMRIAVHQKKISLPEANQMTKNLSSKDGFRSTLSKIIGNNPQSTKGHLNELKIANNAAENGFDVIAIGKKFNDGFKKSDTDIDVLIRKNGRDILIEAKDYLSTTKMDIIKFRGDLTTLNIYANKEAIGNNPIKIFSFTNTPIDKEYLRNLKIWAKQYNVELIFGNPKNQIDKIKLLEEIL